ncbi:MAG: glycosyltransferase [Ilumatobacteraceae bacterium]
MTSPPPRPAITVVTVTRERPGQLANAIESVVSQDYPGTVEHVVVVDDDPETVAAFTGSEHPAHRPLRVHVSGPAHGRGAGRAFTYPHLARLLNVGISKARSPWIAFLDDDNAFEPNHLRSLIELAESSGGDAVHSGRSLVWPDGSPYLEPQLPSAPTPEEGARLYQLLCRRGVCVPGTNVLLDRVDEGVPADAVNSTVMSDHDPLFLVDQNVWLIARELLVQVSVPELFSEQDIAENTCPDDKLLSALVAAGVVIRTTGLPTVRYTVGGGGISNGAYVLRASD